MSFYLRGLNHTARGTFFGGKVTQLEQPTTPKLPALDAPGLRRCRAESCCGDGRQASAKLGETHNTKNLHELPTNAKSTQEVGCCTEYAAPFLAAQAGNSYKRSGVCAAALDSTRAQAAGVIRHF